HPDPDLAVARGAVAYGLALRGLALRVTAGAARAYYVGLDTTGDGRRAMCVVPRGAPEETTCVAEGHGLALIVGKPVRFDLYMSDDAPPEQPGDIVNLETGNFEVAPPLAVHFGKEKSL